MGTVLCVYLGGWWYGLSMCLLECETFGVVCNHTLLSILLGNIVLKPISQLSFSRSENTRNNQVRFILA